MKMMMMTIKDGGWSLFSGGCLATGIMGNGVWIGLCGYAVGFLEMGQWVFFFFFSQGFRCDLLQVGG